jgi:enoyl-CoA hydratase/carnithine racemase
MLTGRPVGSKDAIASGLADEMVDSADDLAMAMRAWVLSCNGAKPARSQREATADAKRHFSGTRALFETRPCRSYASTFRDQLIMLLPLGMIRLPCRLVRWAFSPN